MARHLTSEEVNELVDTWLDRGSDAAREKLVMAFMPLIKKQARKWSKTADQFDDCMQQGAIGFMRALDRFDRGRGLSISTYARYWIMQEIREYAVRNSAVTTVKGTTSYKTLMTSWRKKLPECERKAADLGMSVTKVMATMFGVSEREVTMAMTQCEWASINSIVANTDGAEYGDLIADDAPSPEEIVIHAIDTERYEAALTKAIDSLTDREADIFRRRRFGGEMLDEIAVEYGLSKERIRQLEMKARGRVSDIIGSTVNDYPGA